MIKPKRLEVGCITAPHGLRGEVRLTPWCDDAKIFKTLDKLYNEKGEELRVQSARLHKNHVIIKFEAIDDIDRAEGLRETVLLADRADLPQLPQGESYLVDLMGLEVVTNDGRRLGVLQDWIETGANKVYVVKRESGQDLLLPAIDDVIKHVDFEAGTMTVTLLEGLEDS